MKGNKNVDKNEEIKQIAIEEIANKIIDARYDEAEEILNSLCEFPGSSREELFLLSGACEKCFNRRMAWLEAVELIEFDGDYYYLVDEE